MGILNGGNDNGFYMPVAPAAYGYGGGGGGGLFGGNGGDIWGLLLVLLLAGNGMWGGFGGMGMGGMMWPIMMGGMGAGFGMDYLYPWLNNSEHISDGFRDQQLQSTVNGLQNTVTSGFGDVQLGIAGVNQNICQTGNNITGAVRDGFYGAEIAANGRQMGIIQQLFGVQTAITDCCCKQTANAADLKYTIASEECATRAASANNTRDIIENQTRGIQTILDKLCDQELQAERRENANLRQELLYARGQASQTAQTVQIRDTIIDELRSCPIPAQPVYGSQPIFTCPNNNNNCGCGCGSRFAA